MDVPDQLGLTPAAFDRQAGYERLAEVQAPEEYGTLLPELDQLAPGFPDWIVTALFGGTYQRRGLDIRDRQLVNLAALAALGGVEPQLSGHVRSSLRVGLSKEEVAEVFVHLAPYIGVPKALAGLRAASASLEQTPGGQPGAP